MGAGAARRRRGPRGTRARARGAGLREDVRLPGFRQYGDLPLYYALAGAFIHASTIEPWGLVVNEAAASGLPLLVSDRCGCAPELVGDGENGFTFAPENVEDLARKMAQLAAPDFPRKAFAAASRARVAAWGPERFGRGVAEGLPAVLAGKPAPVGALDRALLHLLLRR
ncbi:MAG: glycosyltransferase [Verrucomicrobiota bacterium]